MTNPATAISRRSFLGTATAAAASMALPGSAGAAVKSVDRPTICAFIKFLQSLSYDEMAKRIADIGFDGTESTVRRKGHVLPERVKDDLPRHYEAVTAQGLDLTIMTTDVLSVDQPYTEDVLRTGASLGVKKYRMGFYRYDLKRSFKQQLEEIRPKVRELAALNQELGITAVYQNHCGVDFVGAPLWDLRYLLEGIPKEQIGSAFDIRHATVEGGLTWPIDYEAMQPHIGAVFVKDFQWDGKKPQHVPLGEGRVDSEFLKKHLRSGIDCPISLHVEYLKNGSADENTEALRRDYKTLLSWLGS
ncbi:MAG: TIM barrel protein [Planctomycetota bacterium]